MSRIQHILDKAEREGVLHRTGPRVKPSVPAGTGATRPGAFGEPEAPHRGPGGRADDRRRARR